MLVVLWFAASMLLWPPPAWFTAPVKPPVMNSYCLSLIVNCWISSFAARSWLSYWVYFFMYFSWRPSNSFLFSSDPKMFLKSSTFFFSNSAAISPLTLKNVSNDWFSSCWLRSSILFSKSRISWSFWLLIASYSWYISFRPSRSRVICSSWFVFYVICSTNLSWSWYCSSSCSSWSNFSHLSISSWIR